MNMGVLGWSSREARLCAFVGSLSAGRARLGVSVRPLRWTKRRFTACGDLVTQLWLDFLICRTRLTLTACNQRFEASLCWW